MTNMRKEINIEANDLKGLSAFIVVSDKTLTEFYSEKLRCISSI